MDDELFDLIPIFLSEARERVQHLFELMPQVGSSGQAVVEARRELHTLKGSCRMLKLPLLAELCHEGEVALDAIGPGSVGSVTALLHRFTVLLEAVAQGAEHVETPAAAASSLPPGARGDAPLTPASGFPAGLGIALSGQSSAPPSPEEGETELPTRSLGDVADAADLTGGAQRVSAQAADRLASGAADLRIRALGGLALAQRAGQLAALAGGGVADEQPEQVLAKVATALRQLAADFDANQRRLLQRAQEQLDGLLGLQLQPLDAVRRGELVVVLRSGLSRLALAHDSIASISLLAPGAVVRGRDEWLAKLGERLVPVLRLSDMLGQEAVEEQVLLEVQAAGMSRYLVVGEVEGAEEVLVRPASGLVPAPSLYTALAVLASGDHVPVLSPRALGDFQPQARVPTGDVARPARLRVLLVEDSLATREMERRLLEDEGFDVTAVSGAREALAQLVEGSFDCVVTDIEMPEMTGLELTRELRGMERFAQLPILVVSTLDQPEDRLSGLQAGADAYLSKQELQAQRIGAVIRQLGGSR